MPSTTQRSLAVVTGASSGIGHELAKQFAGNGFDVVIAAEDAGITTAAADLEALGATVHPVRVDLAGYDGVEQLYAAVTALGRPVDAVAINAGVGVGGDFARETDLRAELNLINLNVTSAVHLAKRLLPEKEILLVGEGALLFARKEGLETVPSEALMTETRREALEQMHDTVGAVAMDRGGNLAAGTSTGGLTGAKVGRIGDSPLPGNGLYADNHVGAVSFSGDGETISRLSLAARVMASLEDGEAMEEAIAKSVAKLPGTGGGGADGGGIGIHKDGTIGWAHNSPMFVVGYVTSEIGEPKVFLKKDEEGG